jgi:hypothetical protein
MCSRTYLLKHANFYTVQIINKIEPLELKLAKAHISTLLAILKQMLKHFY